MFESLETRRLLAVNVDATGGVLTITGDKADNIINVTENLGAVHVETSSLPEGTITEQDFTGITAIKIIGAAGDDQIFYTGNSVGADIQGDNVSGNGGDAGGKGQDVISVDDEGTGSSTVNGGIGDDVITVLRGNNTHVNGGVGDDQIFINTSGDNTGSVIADGDQGKDTFTVYAGTNTIDGGQGKDTLIELGGTNTVSNL